MSSSVAKSDITDINLEVERKINMTAALFPFVCGICYEKFNKIDVYYLHLQAHNQNTSECFHICNDSEKRTQTGSKLNDDRNIFQCGSCLKPFFSICTLHKHMIDVYDIGSYEFDQNSNTAFPKGEMHKNACFRHEVHLENGISQADIEAGDNDLENEAKVECQETVDNNSGTNTTQLKEQTLPVNGKTKRKIKEHKNEIKQKEAKRKKSKEEIEPKEPTVADNETPLKRSRGKQPKPVTKSATKKSNSKRTRIISEVSLKLDKSDIKPLRSKALKTSKHSKEEKGSKKTKKRENKDQTKAIIEGQNKVKEKHIASVHDWNVENIHANNGINADSEDVKSITDVKSSPISDKENGKEDTAVKDEDINSDLNYVAIKCEIIDKDIKDTDEKKVPVRKKRQKIDKAYDGDTVIVKKKSKKYFYTCNICGKTMGLSHKKRHNAIHAAAIEGKPKQEYETCDICGKSIVKAGFKLHQALHSDDRPYLCDRCPKSFKLKSNLHHHKQIHDDFKPHACEICDKRFHRRTDLRFHLRVHSDERPAQCPQCPLRFRKTSTLNIHMKVHRGDKCYQCELCGKAFIRKDYLKRHTVWHSGQPCHECHVCGKKFMEKGGLQRHVKIHSEEKAHICHVCGKGFVLATNMNSHMKHVHSKDKEKKKSGSADVGENPDQTTSAANQTEEPTQNMAMLQTYKVILPEEVKEDQKKEYHTLMPRVCELEMATFPHMGQSSKNYIIQDFTNVQSSFYTGTQSGIQIPYDSSVISQIPIPARQIVEMNGDVTTRHEYTDQQQPSVQTVNVHYANADHIIQYTNM